MKTNITSLVLSSICFTASGVIGYGAITTLLDDKYGTSLEFALMGFILSTTLVLMGIMVYLSSVEPKRNFKRSKRFYQRINKPRKRSFKKW